MLKKTSLFLCFFFSFSCFANYPAYQECKVDEANLWYFPASFGPGAYLCPEITKFIDKKKVSSILEIGSRDARDAIALSHYYQCHVYAFECNPTCINLCKRNVEQTLNVTLEEKAVWDKTGTIDFFPILEQEGKIGDPGSSSCYKLTSKNLEKYAQDKITVSSIRLDEWMKQKEFTIIDMLCMDTQGATLKILQSMGNDLKKTKYIITECEVSNTYEGECLLPELVAYLKNFGFELVKTDMAYDYLFVNKELI